MSMLGKAGKMGEIGASEKTGGPGKTEGPGKTGGAGKTGAPGKTGGPGRTGASGKSAKPVTKGKRAAACAAAAIIGAMSLFAPAAAYGCRLPRYLTKPRQRRSEWDMAGSDGISRVSTVFRGKSLLTNKMRII